MAERYLPTFEEVLQKVFWPKNLLRRQLWSLQDLRDGGGLGFAVELFLLSLKQLLSTFPSHESYSQLYTTTLRPSHLTRESTKIPLGHKNSFSMQLCLTMASFVDLIIQSISRMSSGSCWVICSKDRRAHISAVRCSRLQITKWRVISMGQRRRRWSLGCARRVRRNQTILLRSSRFFMFLQGYIQPST